MPSYRRSAYAPRACFSTTDAAPQHYYIVITSPHWLPTISLTHLPRRPPLPLYLPSHNSVCCPSGIRMQSSSVCSNKSHLPSDFHPSSSFSRTRKRTRTTRTRASPSYSAHLCPSSLLSHALLSEPSAVRDAAPVRPGTLRTSSHCLPPSQPRKSLSRSLSRSAAPSSSRDRGARTEDATAIMYSSDLPRARSGMVQFPISAHMVVPEATDSWTLQPRQSRTGAK